MSTSGSRLAMVANQRRRQRKLAANRSVASNDSSQRENKENKEKIQIGLPCPPTQSSTFDDSTITSGVWSQISGQSTITEDTFNFTPPVTIVSQSKNYRSKTANTVKKAPAATKTDNVPPAVVSATPKRRNLHASYHNKLRNGGSLVSSASTASTAASTAVESSSSNNSPCPAPTPKNNNLSRNNNRIHRNRFRNFGGGGGSVSSAESNDTGKVKSVGAMGNDIKSTASSSSTATNSNEAEKQIKLLTDERNKLRTEVATFRRKFQSSVESKNAITKEKDNEITSLAEEIEFLNKELVHYKRETKNATLSAGDAANIMTELESKVAELTRQLEHSQTQMKNTVAEMKEAEEKREAQHTHEINDLQDMLDETSDELDRVHELHEELTKERLTADETLKEKDRELKRELQQKSDERDEMEMNWKECLDRLDRMKLEHEVRRRITWKFFPSHRALMAFMIHFLQHKQHIITQLYYVTGKVHTTSQA